MNIKLVIVGAGGHAKVVVDAVRAGMQFNSVRVVDQNQELVGNELMGCTVTSFDGWSAVESCFHIAIGDSDSRQRLFLEATNSGGNIVSVKHPAAHVSEAATIAAGCFIAAGAVVGPEVTLGVGTIVNHNAVIDHDCKVGDFAHIAPGATITGNCSIGNRVLIGAGATIRPGVSIEDDAVVGAGAVVVRNIPAGSTVTGCPAKEKT